MAPEFSHFLAAFFFLCSIQPFTSAARTLKVETQTSQNAFEKLLGIEKSQSMNEVIGLKQFLKKYGYYKNPTLTDEFDDQVESAIRSYQGFYHLNATGTLDSYTIKHMMKPRCGVADVVIHPSGKPSSHRGKHDHKSSKFHMVVHYNFFSGQPRWSRYDLTYSFHSGEEVVSLETLRGACRVVSLKTLRGACRGAFSTWEGVSKFHFTEAGSGEDSDITIGFYSGDHGDGQPFDGPAPGGPILAHAFPPEDGRFHYDADEYWSDNPGPSEFDLESLALHEIGHLLGLAHSQDPEAVMHSGIAPGTIKRNLEQDDINGISALYGT